MQVALDGLIAGLMLAVLSLSFTVVYVPTRVFHLALGAIYSIAPFVALACRKAGLSWPLAAMIAAGTSTLISLGCELLNHRPLERRRASQAAQLVSSLGLFIILVQATVIIWGNQPKVLRTGVDPVVQMGHLVLTRSQLVGGGTSIMLLAIFFLWLRMSIFGLRLRGLADNSIEMALRGHNVWLLRLVAFACSGIFASSAAMLMALDVGFDAHSGLKALLLAVVAMVVGGRLSFIGPVIGGIMLGLIRAEVTWVLSSRWQDAVTFLLMALFLLIRPWGMMRQPARVEVEV